MLDPKFFVDECMQSISEQNSKLEETLEERVTRKARVSNSTGNKKIEPKALDPVRGAQLGMHLFNSYNDMIVQSKTGELALALQLMTQKCEQQAIKINQLEQRNKELVELALEGKEIIRW